MESHDATKHVIKLKDCNSSYPDSFHLIDVLPLVLLFLCLIITLLWMMYRTLQNFEKILKCFLVIGSSYYMMAVWTLLCMWRVIRANTGDRVHCTLRWMVVYMFWIELWRDLVILLICWLNMLLLILDSSCNSGM